MSNNNSHLVSELAKAREQLNLVQTRVEELEALIREDDRTPVTLQTYRPSYSSILNNLIEGCQIIGFDWRYLYINDATARHGNQPKEALLGYTMMEKYPGIEQTEMFTTLKVCMEKRVAQNIENEFIYPDGNHAWFELSIQPVPEGIFILSLDITERKQLENTLKRYVHRMEILHQLDLGLIQGGSIQELVDATLKYIRQLIPCQRANLGIIDPNTGDGLLFAVNYDGDTALPQGLRVPILPFAFEGLDERHSRIIPDIRPIQEAAPHLKQFVKEGLVSILQALLMDRDTPIGSLSLLADTPDFFTSEQQEIVIEIASQLAVAIKQMNLSTQLNQHIKIVEETQQFFRSILDAFPANTAVLDPNGNIIHINEPWKRFADENKARSEAYYLGANYLNVCDSASGRKSKEATPTAKGIREVIDGQTESFYIEYPCHSPSESRWFGLRVTPFNEPPPRRVVLAHINITERRHAQDALQDSHFMLERRVMERTSELQSAKERVEAILNNSLDGILLLSANFQIQQTNNAFNRLFAGNADDYFDKSLFELVHADDVDRIKAGIQIEHKEQLGKNIEFRAKRKDNTLFDASLNLGFIKTGGSVCTIRDISEQKTRERQLRFYASLQQNVSDAVLSTDLQFQIQSWNKAAERIYGWREEEVKGKSVSEILKTQYGSPEEQQIAIRQLQQQGWWHGEAHQLHKNGNDIYIWGSVTLIKDENGIPIGVVSINHDITERRQVEQTLRKSADEIHDLYNNAPCGYHSLDVNGVVIQINDTELNWLGYSREEVVGKLKITDIVTPESALAIQKDFPLFKERGWINDHELDFVRKDGSTIHVILNGTAVYDEQGQYIKSRSILFDITELRQAQQSIVDSEARYRLLAENITDVIIRITPEGSYLYVSPSSKAVFGYEPEKMIGKSIYDFIHPDDVERVRQFRQETFLQGIATPFTYRFLHSRGHTIWVEVVREQIRSEVTGEITEYIASARDVTTRKQTEDALKQNEHLLRMILDALPVGVWMIDTQGNITLGNPAGQQIWAGVKYIRLEQYGEYKAWWLDTGKRVEAEDWAAARAIQNGETSINEELEIEAFDGTHKYILNSGIPVRDEQGKILGAITVNQDITERKQAEQAIRESEEKFRQLLDAAPIATIITDQTGQITLFNFQAESLFGYQRTEIIGQTVEILVPDYAREKHVHNRLAYLAAPRIREMGTGMELFAKRKDNSQFPVEIQLSYIETKAGIMVMSFVVDITERKRIAAELESQRIFLKEIIDVSPSMVFVKDYDARFILVNPITAKMYSSTVEDMIGKTDADFNPSLGEIDAFIEADRHVITSGETLFIEEPLTNPSGETRWLQTTKVPIVSSDGKTKYVLGVATDVTERRKSEDALRQAFEKEKELGELKSRFVSMASHEFRTPLATILALTETLTAYRHKLSEDQIQERLSKIQDQIGHLKDIMEDVLLLARMQARRVEFNPIKLNLDALCRSVIDEFQSQPNLKHKLIYTCDAQLHEVMLDKKLMRQIISNLVSNAIKYSKEDKTITISLKYENDHLILKIQDEGIGIPEADLKYLFQPFHRAANVGTISGTGLGMVIIKESVELHGGSISVDTHIGLGTTFVVDIPLNRQERRDK